MTEFEKEMLEQSKKQTEYLLSIKYSCLILVPVLSAILGVSFVL
ncbi:hypothetical protein [Enterovibrio norvegicus]|uniref:Uncharacterized protein n=1 Tax=Enterovibrio norvegicus TaxID=188144 RepID=A0ABV4L7N8_9GAMM